MSLLLASEILIRKQWPTGLTFLLVRIAGLLPVAAVAAYVSYEHLSALLTHYQYSPVSAHIGPLSVDGLMLMASAALLVPDRKAKAAVVKDVAVKETKPAAVDVDGLLLVGRAVMADIESSGGKVTKTAVIAGVRARGHKMGKEKAAALYTALVA